MRSILLYIAVAFSLTVACFGQVTTIVDGAVEGYVAPISADYKYSFTETIYLQSQIQKSGTISSLSFEWDGYSAFTFDNIVIWMGHTTKTEFANTSDWVAVSGLTQVYSGPMIVEASAGWYTIQLDASFTYNNTNNLIIAIDNNHGTAVHNSQASFYCIARANNDDKTLKAGGNSDINPASPGSAVNNYTEFQGNLRLGFEWSNTWSGGTSTNWHTASNWSQNAVPDRECNVTIPSGTTYAPTTGASTATYARDLTINSGATLTVATTTTALFMYGDLVCNGTINHTGSTYIELIGGTANNYATISGTGTMTTVLLDVGYNSRSFYKLLSNTLVQDLNLDNTFGASCFDMNAYDFTTFYVTIESGTNFYQRTGTFRIEQNSASIDNSSFVEGTGTTYFSKGTTWVAGSPTIPSLTYYNLKVRSNNGHTATIGNGSTITVLNDLTFENPGTAGGVITTANDISVGGNLYIGATNNALTLNLANRIYRSSGTGTLSMGNVSAHAINTTYASASNDPISGFGTPTFYGTFTYNSTDEQRVIAATYPNFVTNGSGTKTVVGNLDINGNVTLSNGTLSQGTYSINVAGDWTSTGNYFLEGTGTVTFDGTGSATITGSGAYISTDAATSLFTESFENAGSAPAGWSSEVVYNPSGTAPAVAYYTTSYSPNSQSPTNGSYLLYVNSAYTDIGDQLRYKRTTSLNTTGYVNIAVSFDWLKSSAFSSNNDYVNLQYSTDGTTWKTHPTTIYRYQASGTSWTAQSLVLPPDAENQAQLYIAFLFTSGYGNNCHVDNIVIRGTTSYTGEAFNKLEVAKTSGGGVTLGSKVMVQTSCTYTSGLTTSTSTNFLEYDEDATVAGTVAATCHVNGYVVKRTNSTTKFTFPVGNGSKYRACAVTPSGTASTSWTVKYFASAYSDLSVTGIHHVSNIEYWTIDRSGTSNATIQLTWDASSGVDADFLDLVVAHYNGADWQTAGGNSISGSATSGSISSNANWSAYSPFTLGSNTGTVPLPIELISFTANCNKEDQVDLNWSTASEVNTSHFRVDRSQDGSNWSVVGVIGAAGTTNQQMDYTFTDPERLNGVRLYQLVEVDMDGVSTAYGPVSVDCQSISAGQLEVFPNPFQDVIYIRLAQNLESSMFYQLLDGNGKELGSGKLDAATLIQNGFFRLDMSTLHPAVYQLKIWGKDTAPQLFSITKF